ncbi:MAG: hypothetical protein ACRDRI_17780 [Pseudonocardiaceae bacterium]
MAKVRDLTRWLRESRRAYGSDPGVSSAAAASVTRLLDVSGAEPAKRALKTAVAELHIQAGWDAFGAGLYDRAMHHYHRGLELATETGDVYLQAVALNSAGLTTVEHGRPDDGLAMLQFGQVIAAGIPAGDERTRVGWQGSRAAVQACGLADSATALALMGDPDGAAVKMATARELWQPTAADPDGDLDQPHADLEFERGRLDVAEPLAAASVRRWEAGSNAGRTVSSILLATIHVRAGEPDGLPLTHGAITGVLKLSSLRARRRLDPLVSALEARPGNDHRQLARMARDVATTRA